MILDTQVECARLEEGRGCSAQGREGRVSGLQSSRGGREKLESTSPAGESGTPGWKAEPRGWQSRQGSQRSLGPWGLWHLSRWHFLSVLGAAERDKKIQGDERNEQRLNIYTMFFKCISHLGNAN